MSAKPQPRQHNVKERKVVGMVFFQMIHNGKPIADYRIIIAGHIQVDSHILRYVFIIFHNEDSVLCHGFSPYIEVTLVFYHIRYREKVCGLLLFCYHFKDRRTPPTKDGVQFYLYSMQNGGDDTFPRRISAVTERITGHKHHRFAVHGGQHHIRCALIYLNV